VCSVAASTAAQAHSWCIAAGAPAGFAELLLDVGVRHSVLLLGSCREAAPWLLLLQLLQLCMHALRMGQQYLNWIHPGQGQ